MFELQDDGKTLPGNFSSDELKRKARDGELHEGMLIRRVGGKWQPITNVKGLDIRPKTKIKTIAVAQTQPQVRAAVREAPPAPPRPFEEAEFTDYTLAAVESYPPPAPVTQPVGPPAIPVSTEIACPFCAELIKREAKKCRHCGEILDVTLRAAVPAPQPQYQPPQQQQPAIHIHNVNHNVNTVGGYGGPQWSPLIAAFLSFIWPGLGQIYKGQPINGIVWMIAVFIGYIAFIIPGLILHLCCVIGAASGGRRY